MFNDVITLLIRKSARWWRNSQGRTDSITLEFLLPRCYQSQLFFFSPAKSKVNGRARNYRRKRFKRRISPQKVNSFLTQCAARQMAIPRMLKVCHKTSRVIHENRGWHRFVRLKSIPNVEMIAPGGGAWRRLQTDNPSRVRQFRFDFRFVINSREAENESKIAKKWFKLQISEIYWGFGS